MKRLIAVVAGAVIGGTFGCGSDVGRSQAPAPTPAVERSGVRARDIVAANRKADVDLNLIARVYIDESQVAEFYEPSPGQILFSMAGQPQAGNTKIRAKDVQNLSATQIFQKIAPGIAVPASIARADDRAHEATLSSESLPDETQLRGARAENIAPVPGASPVREEGRGMNAVEINLEPAQPAEGASSEIGHTQLASKVGAYCADIWPYDAECPPYSNYYNWCRIDQWGTSGEGSPYINRAYFEVCAGDDDASLSVLITGATDVWGGGTYGVQRDSVRWVTAIGPTICYPNCCCTPRLFDVSGTVTSNSWYHYTGHFDRLWMPW